MPISSEPKRRTISLSGAQLTLNSTGAGELNEAFGEGTELFTAGEVIGAVSFTAVGE
jgi:hypothetical protein